MTSLVDELRSIVPTRHQATSWFAALSAAQQQEIREVVRLRVAGELTHSWRQIGRLVKSRYHLDIGDRYIAAKLGELAKEPCEKAKPSRKR